MSIYVRIGASGVRFVKNRSLRRVEESIGGYALLGTIRSIRVHNPHNLWYFFLDTMKGQGYFQNVIAPT